MLDVQERIELLLAGLLGVSQICEVMSSKTNKMPTIEALMKMNKSAAIVHLASFVSLLAFYQATGSAKTAAAIKAYRYQISGPNAGTCTTSNATPSQCTVEIGFGKPKVVATINVVHGVLAFFTITAVAHVWYATDGFHSGRYSAALTAGWNPYRWFEYATTATIMSVVIGLVDGTRDITILGLLAAITAAMQFQGFNTESALRPANFNKDTVIGSSFAGWILFIALWGALVSGFAVLINDVKSKYTGQPGSDGKPVQLPTWIWFVVVSQLIYFASFGVAQYMHIQKALKGPVDFLGVEKNYIWLSTFSKVSLAAGLGYGLIFRVKDC